MHELKRQTAAATGHHCQSAGKTHFGTLVALVVRKVELFSPNADGKASVFPSSPSSSPHQFKAGAERQAPLPSAPHVPRDRCCLALLSCVFSWSIFLEGGCQRGFKLSVHKTVRAGRTVLVRCFSVFCLSFTVLTFRRSGRGGGGDESGVGADASDMKQFEFLKLELSILFGTAEVGFSLLVFGFPFPERGSWLVARKRWAFCGDTSS